MSELAEVEIERLRGITVARVFGEVDASNASAIQTRILDGIANEDIGVVIDLTETGYLDSAGIRALFDAGERLQVRGMELRLVATPESFIADVLDTVRMVERFAVDATTPGAVSVLTARLPRERTTE